jgi:endogenous inhibitor of DNA gyrase (YacG/DUF329 family)
MSMDQVSGSGLNHEATITKRCAFRCPECGFEQVQWDASAAFDVATETMLLVTSYCADCGEDIPSEEFNPDDPEDVWESPNAGS